MSLKHLIRTLGLALVAVLAVGAVAVASASATLPAYFKGGVELGVGVKVAYKSASTVAPELETENGHKVKCTADSSVGEIVGPKGATKIVVTFSGCEEPSLKVECENTGLKNKTIVTKELNGGLVYINHTTKETGLALTPTTPGALFAEFTCSPSFLSSKLFVGQNPAEPAGWGKNRIVCPITPINSGDKHTATLTCKQTKGKQEPSAYEEEVGGVWTKIPAFLETESTGSIKFTWNKSAQKDTETITLEPAAEELEIKA